LLTSRSKTWKAAIPRRKSAGSPPMFSTARSTANVAGPQVAIQAKPGAHRLIVG
jgi:hypothetical protein